MARLGWQYAWDEARLRRCLDTVCAGAAFEEMRVRFDVLAAPGVVRGTQSRELITLKAFTPPPRELYDTGVSVMTTHEIQRDDPLTKVASFVQRRHDIEAREPKAYEHLIVNGAGEILEGLSSNFYALHDGVLYTAGNDVLEGVTRRIVLQCAHELAIPVVFAPPRTDAVMQLDEAAISSSSRGLLPVVSIDGHPVGTGVPGPLVGALRGAYDDYVTHHVRRAV
jgi:branched-subunit amino acid aminotransferase/4-amino-4-deoxychorismate lyase